MRYRVVAVRHRGQQWQSKWHFSLAKAVRQAVRWRADHELLSLGVEDERGNEHPIPADGE
jgi:hypothetical protein